MIHGFPKKKQEPTSKKPLKTLIF